MKNITTPQEFIGNPEIWDLIENNSSLNNSCVNELSATVINAGKRGKVINLTLQHLKQKKNLSG